MTDLTYELLRISSHLKGVPVVTGPFEYFQRYEPLNTKNEGSLLLAAVKSIRDKRDFLSSSCRLFKEICTKCRGAFCPDSAETSVIFAWTAKLYDTTDFPGRGHERAARSP